MDDLLDDGFLDKGGAPRQANGVVGEARSLLGEGPSVETREGLVRLVDDCDDATLEILLDHLEPQLARWPETSAPLDTVWYDRDRAMTGAPTSRDPLRVMPKSWLLELAGGREQRKHTLADAIVLDPATLSASTFRDIMSRPRPHVRWLTVRNVKAKHFYPSLARTWAFPNLEVLVIDVSARSDLLAPLSNASSFPSLRVLDPGVGVAALEGEWGSRVEEVWVRDLSHYRWLREHPDQVARVVTRPPRRPVDTKKLAKGLQRAINPFKRAVFSEGSASWGGATLALLERRHPSGLVELDVSRCPELTPGASKRMRKLLAMHPEWHTTGVTPDKNLE